MQATINFIYTQETAVRNANHTTAIIRKEIITKIALFTSILGCLVLAVNI